MILEERPRWNFSFGDKGEMGSFSNDAFLDFSLVIEEEDGVFDIKEAPCAPEDVL